MDPNAASSVHLHLELILLALVVVGVVGACCCGYVGMRIGQLLGPKAKVDLEVGEEARTGKVNDIPLLPRALYYAKGSKDPAVHLSRNCSHIKSMKDEKVAQSKLCDDCRQKFYKKIV